MTRPCWLLGQAGGRAGRAVAGESWSRVVPWKYKVRQREGLLAAIGGQGQYVPATLARSVGLLCGTVRSVLALYDVSSLIGGLPNYIFGCWVVYPAFIGEPIFFIGC